MHLPLPFGVTVPLFGANQHPAAPILAGSNKEDSMPRFPRRPRMSPGMELERIVINLNLGALPSVELTGRAYTGNPRLDATARVVVTTTTLPPVGEEFIRAMHALFGGEPSSPSTTNTKKEVGAK